MEQRSHLDAVAQSVGRLGVRNAWVVGRGDKPRKSGTPRHCYPPSKHLHGSHLAVNQTRAGFTTVDQPQRRQNDAWPDCPAVLWQLPVWRDLQSSRRPHMDPRFLSSGKVRIRLSVSTCKPSNNLKSRMSCLPSNLLITHPRYRYRRSRTGILCAFSR